MDLMRLPLRLAGQVLDISLGIMSSLFSRLTSPVTRRVQPLIPKAKTTAVSVILIAVMLAILLWVSILLYWSFYYTYLPAVSHTRDVNLIFGADCDSHRGICSFPSANMSLVTSGQQPILARGQQYKVNVGLDMPESPVNRELGMFIVKLDFYTKSGEVVRSAHRAAMINYKSTLLRIAETIFFLPMYLLGYYNQKQNVEAQLYNTFTEDPYKPTLGAYLEVQSRFIEIYKATLKIEAQFTGLRYVLFSWPLTSAVMGVGIIMFFFTLIFLLSWYNLFWVGDFPEDADQGTIKYFTGNMEDEQQAENPENIGGNPDLLGDEKVIDQRETEDREPDDKAGGTEDVPLAAQITRRKIY